MKGKFKYEEQRDYEVNKILTDRNAQNLFFGKAISIQNSQNTYDHAFADRKMEFSCDVLVHCGYCNHTMCDDCKLTEANRRAHEGIAAGKRFKEEIIFPNKRYKVRTSVNPNTGVITQIFTPVITHNRKPTQAIPGIRHKRIKED